MKRDIKRKARRVKVSCSDCPWAFYKNTKNFATEKFPPKCPRCKSPRLVMADCLT